MDDTQATHQTNQAKQTCSTSSRLLVHSSTMVVILKYGLQMMKGHRQFEHDVYQKFLVNQKNNKPKGDKKQ